MYYKDIDDLLSIFSNRLLASSCTFSVQTCGTRRLRCVAGQLDGAFLSWQQNQAFDQARLRGSSSTYNRNWGPFSFSDHIFVCA